MFTPDQNRQQAVFDRLRQGILAGTLPAGARLPPTRALAEERVLRWEGCLSIPGLRAAVPRAPRIRYRGVDCDGKVVAREVSGFHAGVVQHEYDHLDGILYPMRMKDFSLFGFTEELARAAAAQQQAS